MLGLFQDGNLEDGPHHKEVVYKQEFDCLEMEGKKQLASKFPSSSKQRHPPTACKNLLLMPVMRDAGDEVKG